MRRITMVQTSDGVVHANERHAKQHAEKRYGDALTAMVRRLLENDKYMKMHEFLDANLDDFIELRRLKNDITVENPDDGGE